MTDRRILVTGGAGFIGSHLVGRLRANAEVDVLDDLSSGEAGNLPPDVRLHEVDLTDTTAVETVFENNYDLVFHLAAESDVRQSARNPTRHTERNMEVTLNLLEAMRRTDHTRLIFTSSSAVYGEGAPLPTPESHGPLEPISAYGASKLGCEAACTAFAGSFGFDVTIYRLANVVGDGCRGVVPDFVEKLRCNPDSLEVLGDGHQLKSYVHVSDCVEGILAGIDEEGTFYNIGSRDTVTVTRIGEIICDEMGLDADFDYTGDERGWSGDVPRMHLSVERLASTGWEPKHGSEESIRRAVRGILEQERENDY